MPTKRLIIKGRVQGVFYRATAKDVAEENGITGWVKNTAEGYVEIMATGSGEQLENFLQWCRQGPPRAQVTAIEQEELPEQGFDGFRITRYWIARYGATAGFAYPFLHNLLIYIAKITHWLIHSALNESGTILLAKPSKPAIVKP